MTQKLGVAEAEIKLDTSKFDAGVKRAKTGMSDLDTAGKRAGNGLASMQTGLLVAGAAFGTLAVAAGKAWAMIKEGAALDLARGRFDNLSKSINTTGDALLGKLRDATHGMVSDAQLVASASDMMNLGFAKTEEQAVRLTSVAGQLGWNMQQLTLTLANQSTMRLDALGLSVGEVTGRFKELKAEGVNVQDAFQLAVIEAGEAKLGLLGSAADTAAGQLQQLNASGENLKNTFSSLALDLFSAAGGIEAVGNAASNLSILAEAKKMAREAQAQGLDTGGLDWAIAKGGDWQEVVKEIKSLDAQMKLNANTWGSWAFAVNNGIVTTGKFTHATATADKAMIAQGQRFRDASNSLEAYGETAYTAALAQEQLADVDLDYLNAQIIANERLIEMIPIAAQAAAEARAFANQSFNEALGAGADALFSPVHTVSFVTSGGISAADTALLGEYGDLAKKAEREVYELTNGIGTFGMTQDQVNKKLEKANGELAYYQGLMAPIQGISTEYGQRQEGMALNVEAANAALYNQIDAVTDDIDVLGAAGVALGIFTEEQANAALNAAMMETRIKFLAEQVAAGNITVEVARQGMLSFAETLMGNTAPAADTAAGRVRDLREEAKGFEEDGPYESEVLLDTSRAEGKIAALREALRGLGALAQNALNNAAPPPNNPTPHNPTPHPPPIVPQPGHPDFAIGGYIYGTPGASVNVNAHAGEYVLRPEAVASLGVGLLNALNAHGASGMSRGRSAPPRQNVYIYGGYNVTAQSPGTDPLTQLYYEAL